MKRLRIFIFYFLVSSNFLQAKSDLPKEFGCARLMTVQLSNNSLLGGKPIPEGWSDFMFVNYMKTEARPSAYILKLINSFALVPTCPSIKKSPGIPTEYSGKRLFLISRYKIYKSSSAQGRCMILIRPSSAGSGKVISDAYFIPEATAQLILAQIPDFDPTEQPLAFDDNFLQENKNKFQGKDLDSTILAIEKDKQAKARSASPQQPDSIHKKDKDSIQKNLQKVQAEKDANPIFRNFITWLVIGISIILGIVFWRFINRIKNQKDTVYCG